VAACERASAVPVHRPVPWAASGSKPVAATKSSVDPPKRDAKVDSNDETSSSPTVEVYHPLKAVSDTHAAYEIGGVANVRQRTAKPNVLRTTLRNRDTAIYTDLE
jgi:hypothetical protein